MPKPGVAGEGDKLKSPVVAEVSNFSATKGKNLFTLVSAEISSECKCEEHNQRSRGCCAAWRHKKLSFHPRDNLP